MPNPAPAQSEADDLLISQTGRVRTLTLARPPAHSMSLEMLAKLHSAINNAGTDTSVNVIILASTGPIFCAGHDLREIQSHRSDADKGRAFLIQLFDDCSALMQAIVNSPKPVIAMVHGVATAAGCQLVASCDLAFASEQAQFCTPGVNIGGFCSTPMVALSRNVSRKAAMEMLLTGEMMDAQAALTQGLVNRVVPSADLAATVAKFAQNIAAKSPVAIARGKQAFYKQADMPLAEAYAYASAEMVESIIAPDCEEGVGAFLEKRTPSWPDTD